MLSIQGINTFAPLTKTPLQVTFVKTALRVHQPRLIATCKKGKRLLARVPILMFYFQYKTTFTERKLHKKTPKLLIHCKYTNNQIKFIYVSHVPLKQPQILHNLYGYLFQGLNINLRETFAVINNFYHMYLFILNYPPLTLKKIKCPTNISPIELFVNDNVTLYI